MTWKQLCCILVFGACVVVAQARVVINEVLYNAPGDYDSLQFVELANQGREPVELGGWFFSKGIRHVFPPGSVLKPGGFIVLASDAVLFQEVYGSLPTAVFKGRIRKEGEELEISDASGRPMDRVVFSDRHPWPVAADGFSASLERISPDTPGDLRDNWEASSLSAQPGRPGGTPGATNGVFSTNLPPRLSLLTLLPSTSKPGAQLPIECEVSDRDGIDSVTLVHSRARSGSAGEEERTPMVQGAPGVFQGRLLIGKETGAIHRVYFEARDRLGAVRRLPGASEPRPAFSIWASEDTPSLTVPIIHLIQTSKPEMERLQKSRVQGGGPGAFAGRRGGGDDSRDRNSRLLRSGLDFTYIWTRLALRQGISGDSLVLVRPLFLEGAAAYNRVTGDAIASFGGGSTEKAVQEVLRQRKAFAGRLTGLLEPEARREFDRWWAETGEKYNLPGTPPAAQPPLRRLWDLERGFAGMTLTSDASSQQINEWRAWILESTKARDELVGRENASPLEDPATMERLQEKLEPLRRALSERITAGAGAAKHADYEGGMAPRFRPTQAPDEREPVQGTSAMVYVPPGDGAAQVFDYVTLTSRAAGYKVYLHKDRMLHSMSTLNLIFEYNERFVVAEPMAFEFYRRAGVPAPQTEFARLYVDGEPLGYHLLVEQPNKSFLRRNRIQEDGHLYKLLWYGKGLVGQHEKKTRERSGHTDLQALVTELQATTDPKELGQLIERRFNVGEVASYFAVNACLSHWDGFFNNYFAYHDTEGTRRWTLFPWDQDKAWGFHDGLGPDEIFFDMPLSYGMAGDQRPAASGLAGLAGLFGFGGRGFHVWWRPGGWFSKPLLANPMFRQIYLRRIKQLLQEEYVLSKWEPAFVEMERKLTPEVKFRAEILNESPEQAVTRLRRDIDLLRKHITRRRDFLLAQPELQQIP